MSKKYMKIYILIYVFVLVISIVGATLAYFSMSNNDNDTSKISSSFSSYGGVSLSTPIPSIHLSITNEDMSISNEGTSYFSTNDVGKHYESERVDFTAIKIQTLKNSDENSYDCSLEFGIDVSGSLKDELKANDAILYLSGDYNAELDLTDKISNIKVNYTLNNDNNTKEIKIALKFNNKEDIQNNLASNSLNLTTKVINFICNGSN